MHLIARIGKAHGLRGEVTVQAHTDDPETRFTVGAEFATEPAAAGPLVLRSARVHQGTYLLGFEGHADRTAAEGLRGVQLLAEGVAEPDEDAWYPDDLVGYAVVLPDRTPVGQVSALHTRPVQDLLEVSLATGGTALVPFVEEIVPEVDEDAEQVVIDPPPGLLELGE